jgi:hypothetical protein
LAQVIRSEAVIAAIRKELRRRTTHNANASDIRRLLDSTILRPECLDERKPSPRN